jgi:hypothetical protein
MTRRRPESQRVDGAAQIGMFGASFIITREFRPGVQNDADIARRMSAPPPPSVTAAECRQ